MTYSNIGFIGCGNMGSALARAAAGKGRLYFADALPQKAEALAKELEGTVCDNAAIGRTCDLIFLSVRPQMMEAMLLLLRPILAARRDRFVLASMATALTTQTIADLAGGEYPVIRIMPNVAASVGAGMIQYCARNAEPKEVEAFCGLMEKAGIFDCIDENLIDAASAVSSCGLAYVSLALEAMADGGVACGLPRDKALLYAAQTLIGAGKLVRDTGDHPGVLKDKVCSSGGTTIQGVRALEDAGARAAFFEAVIASYEKTLELK